MTRDDSRALLMTGALTLLSCCVFAVVYWSQHAAMLNMVFLGVALVIGGWLYISHPPLYVGFVWWVWFLSPLVRRIIDYEAGYHNPMSLVTLTPYLVTGFTLFSLLRYGGRLKQPRYFPFLLCLSGLLYGYLIGIVKVGAAGASYGLLQWLSPVLLGFHVLLFWNEYPAHRRVVRTTFTWGVLVMSVYGIYQFVHPPAWDLQWMREASISSLGRPEPGEFRIYSTLSATGLYAMITMAGLLLLFDARGWFPRMAMVPGYVGLMLSLVRTAWGGWVLGLLFLVKHLQGEARKRMLLLLVIGIILAVPFLLHGPGADRVGSRVGSLGNIEEEGSFRARVKLYRSQTGKVLLVPLGEGIGAFGTAAKLSTGSAQSLDSGLLQIPLTLGWLGTLLYVGGLVWIMRNALRSQALKVDRFAVIVTGVAVAYLAANLMANQLIAIKGNVFWSFIGLALAAQSYHEAHHPYKDGTRVT